MIQIHTLIHGFGLVIINIKSKDLQINCIVILLIRSYRLTYNAVEIQSHFSFQTFFSLES